MECPKSWPEPVVPVQSLTESGATLVPARYVKPPSERPSLDTLDQRRGISCIPVIDLAGLTRGPAERAAAERLISDACRDWGFFQVENHGVSLDLVERMRADWREFFDQPTEAKTAYANSPATYEGYGSRLGVDKGAILDWGDYFFLVFTPQTLRNRDKWPAFPATCRKTTEEYGREVVRLCGALMEALSTSLGLGTGALQRAFGGDDGVGGNLRVNFYPRCPQSDLTLGLSSHSDPGGITILLADERVKGLQVRKDGNWVTVQPRPGNFIVNIGDQLQLLSNGVYKSVEHRVVVNPVEERISFAFFYNPRGDLKLGPLPELVMPDRPALYQPMTFDEYRKYIRLNGPRGKLQLESIATNI
ncbi:hypothetical protein Taro_036068 [Colocasia esculenta]|uniref:Fe2OG dioxygenase domain-containing protein n=1 Tax=Colocasia esculenta TaxID=4460 RepID=A0A843WGQ5_COLES|nr:hypothetical protein [Colocasia esculenta]